MKAIYRNQKVLFLLQAKNKNSFFKYIVQLILNYISFILIRMNNNEFLFKKAKEYIANLRSTKLEEKTELIQKIYLMILIKLIKIQALLFSMSQGKVKKDLDHPTILLDINITQGTIGCIEVKKVEQNLDETLKSSQIGEYKNITRSILLTNYIEFIWIKDKEIKLREFTN